MACSSEFLSSARAFLEQPVESDYETARKLEVRVIGDDSDRKDMVGNHGVFVRQGDLLPEGPSLDCFY